MNETLSRDEQVAPTLRSSQLGALGSARSRPAPEVMVAALPAWSAPRPGATLLSWMAREVAGVLLQAADRALGSAAAPARARHGWS